MSRADARHDKKELRDMTGSMQTDFVGNNTNVLTVAELTRAIRGTPFVTPSEVEESLATCRKD